MDKAKMVVANDLVLVIFDLLELTPEEGEKVCQAIITASQSRRLTSPPAPNSETSRKN